MQSRLLLDCGVYPWSREWSDDFLSECAAPAPASSVLDGGR
jgi:hypothetical protein